MLARIMTQFDSFRDQSLRVDINWDEVHHMLLDFCVRIIPKVISAEHCSIYINDPANREAWLKAGTGTDEKKIDVSLDEDSIVSEVIRTGKSIIVNDVQQQVLDRIDPEEGLEIKDVLCVPVRSLDGQKIMGAVQLLNRMYGHKFSDADLSLMQEMALFLEQSLENVYYRSLTQGLVQKAALITKVTSFLGLLLLLGLTGAFTLWVMWIAIENLI
jgi:GAF domain-containing protein